MIIFSIYLLRDPQTNEVRYIGMTRHQPFTKRLNCHLEEAVKHQHICHKCSWIRRLTVESLLPIIELIETTEDNWQNRERYWIKFYRDCGAPLTNLTDGGDGSSGYKWTEEQLMNLQPYRNVNARKAWRKRRENSSSEEISTKASKAAREGWETRLNKNGGLTDKEKEQRREWRNSRPHAVSAETRALISQNQLGKKRGSYSEAHKQAISKSLIGKPSHKQSAETREKIRSSMIGRKRGPYKKKECG